MRLSTGLFILVSVCLLTSCGGGGSSGTTTTQASPHDIPVNLGCKGNNDVHIGDKAGIVTFSVPASCTPLQSITPDPPVPGFTNKVISNGKISYNFAGGQLPSDGYPFSYSATGVEQGFANNGTGVIKN